MTSDASNAPRCPWCSAALPSRRAPVTCPSCGASLVPAEEEIPGLTRVDPEVLIRTKPSPGRSRLLGWLSGDTEPLPVAAPKARMAAALAGVDDRASLEPPSDAVRREMRLLEQLALEAELAASDARSTEEPGVGAPVPGIEPAIEPETDATTGPEEPRAVSPSQPVREEGTRRRSRAKGSTTS